MSTPPRFDGPEITLVAAEAITFGQRLLVNSSGQWAVAVASQRAVAVAVNGAASAARVAGRILNRGETHIMIASEAIAVGNRVFGAAAGKVGDTASGHCVGIALTASSADGDQLNILVCDEHVNAAEAHTADDTLTVSESGTVHTTYGASGTVTFSLPAAVKGLRYKFVVGAAQELRIDPNGTETISLPSTGVAGAAGKYLTANAAGESVELECVSAGTWAAFAFTGTWTAEA